MTETESSTSRAGVEALLEQIMDAEASFEARRKPLRRLDQVMFIAQSSLILLTTIFSGLKLDGHDGVLRNCALATSATASFLTVIIGRFVFRDRWIAFTEASSRLAALRSKIELVLALASARQREIPSGEEILAFHKEMQDVFNRVDARWSQLLTAAASTGTRGTIKTH